MVMSRALKEVDSELTNIFNSMCTTASQVHLGEGGPYNYLSCSGIPPHLWPLKFDITVSVLTKKIHAYYSI